MRFCMVTTFFGPHAFGGDAIYVDRLVRALLRQGHEVEVVYSVDAFHAAGGRAERLYEAPPGLRVHALESAAGFLAPLWSQQTGRLPPRSPLRRIVSEGAFDVVHFHNASLMGAPAALEVGREDGLVRLLSAHEHWLVCPMHILWKLDREVCEKPQCVRCTLQGRRLPQLWRYTALRDRALASLDAVICGSEAMIENHRARGITAPLVHIPTFVPPEWAAAVPERRARPTFVIAGRLIKAKGLQDVIPLMARLPAADLVIAGDGPYESELRALADPLPNVELVGQLDGGRTAALLAGARAAIVPSLCHEAFANVPMEAFSVGTPVVARRLGALEEVVERSGGGLLFSTAEELLTALEVLLEDEALARRLGEAGREANARLWSEEAHLAAYLGLIESLVEERSATTVRIP